LRDRQAQYISTANVNYSVIKAEVKAAVRRGDSRSARAYFDTLDANPDLIADLKKKAKLTNP